MRVRVYYNLRKHCLSVMDKQTRRVIKHADAISLSNVKFIVSAKGVARIRKKKRKSVVAFIEGDLVAYHTDLHWCSACKDMRPGAWHSNSDNSASVTFNPYKNDSFVLRETGVEITEAPFVTLDGKKVTAYNVCP